MARGFFDIYAEFESEVRRLRAENETLKAYAECWKYEYQEEVRKHTSLLNRVYGGEFGIQPEGNIYDVEFVVSDSVKVIEEQFRTQLESQGAKGSDEQNY